MVRIYALAAGSLLVAAPTASSNADWPRMPAFAASWTVKFDGSPIDINVPLRDAHGKVRYRFICRGGSVDYLDAIESAVFVHEDPICILSPGAVESEASLFSEDDSAAYFSRGALEEETLVGACAAYPEYGQIRHFRLRGFILTLSVREIRMRATPVAASASNKGGRITTASIGLSLRADPTARTAIAEPPGYLDPKGNPAACRTIRKGMKPRMCRNPVTFSWQRCPKGFEYKRFSWERD